MFNVCALLVFQYFCAICTRDERRAVNQPAEPAEPATHCWQTLVGSVGQQRHALDARCSMPQEPVAVAVDAVAVAVGWASLSSRRATSAGGPISVSFAILLSMSLDS